MARSAAMAQGKMLRHAGTGGGAATLAVAEGSGAPERTSSMEMRASPMAWRRWRGSFLQTALHEHAEAARSVGGEQRPVRRIFDDRGKSVGNGFAVKRHLAGEHFVQHAAEGPDVRAAVRGFAAGLLGGHVGCGADDDAGLRGHAGHGGRTANVGGGGFIFESLGEAEVENFYGVFGRDFDVGGF